MTEYDDEELERLKAISSTDQRREQMQAGQPIQPDTRGLPQIQDVVWPKERPQYRVKVWLWRGGDGRFECSAFDISRVPGARPISSTTLRELPVAELIDQAIQRYLATQISLADAALAEGVRGQTDDEFVAAHRAYWQEAGDAARQQLERVKGEGKRPRYDADHFEEVVRVVREAERDGRPKQTAVAHAFGISRSAAGNHIAVARAKGLFDLQTEDEEREE